MVTQLTDWSQIGKDKGRGKIALEIGAEHNPWVKYIFPEASIFYMDLNPRFKPDILCDAAEIPKKWDNHFDIILASHVLEHFAYNKVVDVLKGWHKCIKENGILIVCVPSLEWASKVILNGFEEKLWMGHIYGGQDNIYNTHHMGFTHDLLEECITRADFKIEFDGWSFYNFRAYDFMGDGKDTKNIEAEQHVMKARKNGKG